MGRRDSLVQHDHLLLAGDRGQQHGHFGTGLELFGGLVVTARETQREDAAQYGPPAQWQAGDSFGDRCEGCSASHMDGSVGLWAREYAPPCLAVDSLVRSEPGRVCPSRDTEPKSWRSR